MIFGGHDVNDGFGLDTALRVRRATNSYRALQHERRPLVSDQHGAGQRRHAGDLGQHDPGNLNQPPQVFQDKTQTWRTLTGANRNMALYPMMFLAPDGQVFNAGPDQTRPS